MFATITRIASFAAVLVSAAIAVSAQPVAEVTKPAAEAAAAPLTSAELRAAVDAFRKSSQSPAAVYASWGEYVTPTGSTFVPVSLYLPKADGLSTDRKLTFFGIVEDASGKTIASYEEPAVLSVSQGDFHFDRTLTGLPAGKHRAIFGLAEGGKTVAITGAELELAGALDKDAAAASPLILSNNVYPLAEAQTLTAPFSFGGVKVVPKGDRAFRPADELWYFVELRNPGLNEMQQPRVQVRIDLEGVEAAGGKKVRMSSPPREVDIPEMKGVPRHHGLGSSIPLSSFQPGNYTVTVKVTDTIRKSSYTLKEEFRIIP